MKKLITLSVAGLIALTGCGEEKNELISAIDGSYGMESGAITTTFSYTTEYDNIDLAGEVEGTLDLAFDKELDSVIGSIEFGDKTDNFEYFIDSKGNITSSGSNQDVLYSSLYEEAPDLSDFVEQIPTPESVEIDVDGSTVTANQYKLELDKLNTNVAIELFDPIIKLGFISAEVLNSDNVTGSFDLTFNVDPETSKMINSKIEYSNEEENEIGTKTDISIENVYSYEEQDVQVASDIESASDSEASEATA